MSRTTPHVACGCIECLLLNIKDADVLMSIYNDAQVSPGVSISYTVDEEVFNPANVWTVKLTRRESFRWQQSQFWIKNPSRNESTLDILSSKFQLWPASN
jgi:hypothetical protein